VKEDREPNFALFADKPNVAGLDFLEGVLSKVLPKEKIEDMKVQGAAEAEEKAAEAAVEEVGEADAVPA
jgi:hypothetical protein